MICTAVFIKICALIFCELFSLRCIITLFKNFCALPSSKEEVLVNKKKQICLVDFKQIYEKLKKLIVCKNIFD